MHPKYAAVVHLQENSHHEPALLDFLYLKVCIMGKMQMPMYLGHFRSCSCSALMRLVLMRIYAVSFYGMKHILEVCKTSCFREHVKHS